MILGSYNSEAATGGVLEKGVLNPIMNGGNFLLFLSLLIFSNLRKSSKSYEFKNFSLSIKIA